MPLPTWTRHSFLYLLVILTPEPQVCVKVEMSHWASHCTDTRAFYSNALFFLSFFLGFRQWRSSADWVLTLNMNIRLPLFWSTWSTARGQDSATCAGLAHGRDYSNYRASEQKSQMCLAFIFPWIVKNTWKTKAMLEGFLTLIPRTVEMCTSMN